MADGYRVDLDALRTTAEGLRRTVAEVRTSPLEPVGSAAGHEGLATAVDGFVDRWQRGLGALITEAGAMADQLDADARRYAAAEQAGAHALGTVVAGAGPDPGAR